MITLGYLFGFDFEFELIFFKLSLFKRYIRVFYLYKNKTFKRVLPIRKIYKYDYDTY